MSCAPPLARCSRWGVKPPAYRAWVTGRFEVLWASSQEGASLPTYLRYAAGAIVAIVVLVLALAPLASVLVNSWSQRDLESRSRLVFVSIKDYAARQLAVGGSPALTALLSS